MFRYTRAEMGDAARRVKRDPDDGRTTRCGRVRHARLWLAPAAALLAGLVVACLPAAALADPGDSVADLRAQAADVRAEVEKLDRRASVSIEKYDQARAKLDELNVRLFAARRELVRVQSELETAQELLADRAADIYKSGDVGVLDVLFSVRDFTEIDTQFDYVRSINEADQASVDRVAALSDSIVRLARDIEGDRAAALKRETELRAKQADIEDQLAQRQALLDSLDARVKELVERQARVDAAASLRLAAAAGVDLDDIAGTPAQIAVVKETMKYLGIDYVWGGDSPSGGFDCSGLVLYVYAKFGVDFPHGATMQASMGTPVALADLQPADLVFFGDSSFYHHVGIYIGNGLFIEAPHTGDVVKVSRLAGRGCALACRYDISL